ncbi:hypothetical protein [Lysinibacillus xylanilyticus]|uniref:hypothetical protein n=1 Tax=Lysinibacillus xylanilyticus TaxID=582475 RepID=UPI0011120E0C|nr:hypothetical protein [Lysinibacillus xylanilyticus]
MGISNRGTKAKTITSCDNAFVTNIVLARDPGASNASEVAHRTPPGSFALCESEASAMFYLCESATTATTNVLSARKRSVSGKCLICSESKATATKRPVGTEINPTLLR